MAFRFSVTILLLYTATSVLTTSSEVNHNISITNGNSEKEKPSPVHLSVNIDRNPFLQDRGTTVPANYQRNPFLSVTHKQQRQSEPQPQPSPGQVFGNDSEHYQNASIANDPLVAKENQNVNIVVYIHNPFLQGGSNPPTNSENPVNGNRNGQNSAQTLAQSFKSDFGQENLDTGSRTKSDLKCDEYSRQISDTTEVLSLVGATSEVIKVGNEKCRKANHLVVGGTAAREGEFPHMVALGTRTTDGSFLFSCGGTLIAPEWVLTAAHCTYGPNGSPTDARIGFQNLTDNEHGITSGINRTIRHPNYRPPAMYADIALLKLSRAVSFNRQIRPACLYQPYDTVPTQAWVSGWGVTEFGGEQSDQLQKAQLDIVDNIACTIRHNKSIAVPYGVSPSMVCAGDPRGGWTKDTCQGDSGGPLQVIHPKNLCLFQVIGITSFGQGCAIVGSPGVYTRVPHYLSWIEDIVWPNL